MSVTPWATGELFNRITLNQRIEETNNDIQAAIQEAIEGGIAGGIQVVSGARTGNGTYGSENKIILNFSTRPLAILYAPSTGGYGNIVLIRNCSGYTPDFNVSTYLGTNVTWSSNSVSWYHDSDRNYQGNNNGVVYRYIAICEGGAA